ncbi:MAG: GNAT family N-acetyltransferase [Bryobacterales bacterium]|nr:GNAT family N-acetyltransferase [Bryobacterales bacterium]
MRQPDARLVDLSQLRGSDLEVVLKAQRLHWCQRLAWDNRDATDAIRRLLDQRCLTGLAVLVDGRPVGYSYIRLVGSKAVVGEVFLLPAERVPHLERMLLEMTIIMASRNSGVKRVEGQLASLADFPDVQIVLPGELQVYPRRLMIRESDVALPRQSPVNPGMRFLPWTDSQLQAASELIALAYAGHVDASINEEYCSVPGARRFLEQTINRGSSGRFLTSAGFVARQASSSRLGGICVGSMVGAHVGHIAQLCVAPEWSGFGIGTELLRRALDGFRRAGCDAVSLTVTASNERAIQLYERTGFRTLASFPAFVWHPA